LISDENKKGRIHGLGHSLDLAITPNGSSSTVVGPLLTNPNLITRLVEDITAIATKMTQMQE